MLYLVYGSSSSSYVDCVVNFDDECLLIDGLGFVCPRARLLLFGSSICCSPCRYDELQTVTRHNLCFSHRVYDYVHALCCAE